MKTLDNGFIRQPKVGERIQRFRRSWRDPDKIIFHGNPKIVKSVILCETDNGGHCYDMRRCMAGHLRFVTGIRIKRQWCIPYQIDDGWGWVVAPKGGYPIGVEMDIPKNQ